MAPPFTRASRPYVFTPAAGSSVLVKQYNTLFQLVEPGTTFDIETGVLVDTYKNQNTTNSGDNGGENWTRVGGAWNYALTLSFPAGLIGGALAMQFVQQLLGSSRYVWMQFSMGDQEFWEGLYGANAARTFIGDASLLTRVEQRWDCNGQDVVGLNVAGVGSSLLRAMYGDSQVHP